jgi:DnaJ-class molecular chaperone
MSTRKTVIEIEAPSCPVIGVKENFLVLGVTCGYCGGRGWFSRHDTDEETESCPICNGTGMVDAKVDVQWAPTKIKRGED